MGLSAGTEITPTLRLVRELGRGGMGSVWVADHLALDTQVAVKLIDPDLQDRPGFLARFQREAKAAAGLKSPHVVQIFDQGLAADGTPFIVMELLEGESLAQRLDRTGPLTLTELAIVVAQVAKALSVAHHMGVIHRDIKPENIFLVSSPEHAARAGEDELLAKVLDFGIAKRIDPSAASSATQTGAAMGTPAYMSPEQMSDTKSVGPATDLYALGVVAFRALLQKLPFEGDTIVSLWQAVVSGKRERPTAVDARLPAELDGWFDRALAAEPGDRFPSARAMAEALTAIASQADPSAAAASASAATPKGSRATRAATDPTVELQTRPRDTGKGPATAADTADTCAYIRDADLPLALDAAQGVRGPAAKVTEPIMAEEQPVSAVAESKTKPGLTAQSTTTVAVASVALTRAQQPARPHGLRLAIAGIAALLVVALGYWAWRTGNSIEPRASERSAASGSVAAAPADGGTTASTSATAAPSTAPAQAHLVRGVCKSKDICVKSNGMVAWCDVDQKLLACCAPGLVAESRDGICGCPPGGTDDPKAATAGCPVSPTPPAKDRSSGIQRVVRAEFPRLEACYKAGLGRNAKLAGRVVFWFELSPDGDVYECRIDATTMADVEFQKCLLDVFHSLKFPPPFGGGMVTVSYPIVFDDKGE